MSHPVRGVDHTFLLVNNLEESAEHYRRLGFTLSPRGLHSKEKGTGNYTIMFPKDYFELLGIVAETAGNLHQREKLAAQGEGLHAIACRIDSASQAKAELATLGLETGEVGSFSRPVQLPNGGEGVAAFETASFSEREVPQGMVFMCQHKTRETVWLPELIEHENGAIGLSAIVAVSVDAEVSAKRFAKLFADAKATGADGVWRVYTGPDSADILVYDRSHAEQLYGAAVLNKTSIQAFSGLRIRVASLDKVCAVLKANNVAYTESSGRIIVSPDDANGTILEFTV
ncbi:VOC family protein [Brucella thiophenivorans]|uniref:Glyoxalase-like domain protein n=1 Tax=Brucella thiophenivorans TaxID=571255 RepID=A0A256FJ82_9HYPH|nr:VOC family protein [Brucella thiophenivorans]OYR14897.1 glyoxalase-like domain protein [Brucella thiophenivorans]